MKSGVTNLLQNFITSVNKILRFCLAVNGSYPDQIHHLIGHMCETVHWEEHAAVHQSACMQKISLYVQFIPPFYVM